jgi:hypothetical protein
MVSVRTEVRAGTLRAIPFSKGGLHRNLGILLRKGRERPQIMEQFIRLLQSEEPEEET